MGWLLSPAIQQVAQVRDHEPNAHAHGDDAEYQERDITW